MIMMYIYIFLTLCHMQGNTPEHSVLMVQRYIVAPTEMCIHHLNGSFWEIKLCFGLFF